MVYLRLKMKNNMGTIRNILRYVYVVLQWAFCLLCWLVLPPVLLFLYKPIRSKWIRLTLALISPIMILLYVELYHICERKYRYNNPIKIEAIIGIKLPFYKVVDYQEKRQNTHMFNGYHIYKTLEFKSIPNDLFFDKLDSICMVNPRWRTFKKEESMMLDSLIGAYSGEKDITEIELADKLDKFDSIIKIKLQDLNDYTTCYSFDSSKTDFMNPKNDFSFHIYLEKGNRQGKIYYRD